LDKICCFIWKKPTTWASTSLFELPVAVAVSREWHLPPRLILKDFAAPQGSVIVIVLGSMTLGSALLIVFISFIASEQFCQKVSPPANIMSAQPWNTVAKRNILINLMELLLQESSKRWTGNANNLDDYLMGFSGQPTTWTSAHSLFKLPAVKYYAFAIIVATAAMAAKHLTILGVIL
jgi:hypothetical protein